MDEETVFKKREELTMRMNQTPAAERIHIGFFGRRNAGKSSVMNAVTGQNLAVVSNVKGTTTDPVYKAMELLPLGPVMMIDTPGIDDKGELGELRVRKSHQILNKTDLAVLVVDGTQGMKEEDYDMVKLFEKKKIPYVVVFNKADLAKGQQVQEYESQKNVLWVSTFDNTGIKELKEHLSAMLSTDEEKKLLEGLIEPGDMVVLVTPIDKAAPKGRLILPQQQTIRALLDNGCISIVVRETELEEALKTLGKKPKLVITDSQAFKKVSNIVPEKIPLTSFSILFARYKGDLRQAVEGVRILDQIQDEDKILISEGCTHHRQCGDIGTVKLPLWIRQYTKKEPIFSFTSGTEFPEKLSDYRLVVHCGGCMLNEREMRYRQACAKEQGISMANYGILIAFIHGILKRSLEPFPDIKAILGNGETL